MWGLLRFARILVRMRAKRQRQPAGRLEVAPRRPAEAAFGRSAPPLALHITP